MGQSTAMGPMATATGQLTPCAVIGAAGFVGRELVDALLRDSALRSGPIVVVGRHRSTLPWLPGLDVRPADVGDEAATAAALSGVRCCFYLVHSLNRPDFMAEDLRLARAFAHAARRAGVQKIVFLGTLGPRGGSNHIDGRHLVARMLATTGIPTVELRVGPVFGPGSPALRAVHRLVDRVPVIALTPWAFRNVNAVSGHDAARALVAAAIQPAGVYDLCGRDTCYAEMMRAYASARGLRRVFVPVPWMPHFTVVAALAALDWPNRNLTAAVVGSTRVDIRADPTRALEFKISDDDPIRVAVEELERTPPTPGVVRVGWRPVAAWPHDIEDRAVAVEAERIAWPLVGGRPRRRGTVTLREGVAVVHVSSDRRATTAVIVDPGPPRTATLWCLPRGLLGEARLRGWSRRNRSALASFSVTRERRG